MDTQKNRFHAWWEKLPNAFAYHQILVDKEDKPLDYVFLYVNAAFEKMTGLKKGNIIGKKVTEIIPGIEGATFDWIGTYGKVALYKKQIRFEQYSEPLSCWYDVTAFSDKPGYFATVFFDITHIKKTEQKLRQSEERNRSIVEALPDILIIVDQKGRYLDIIASSEEKLYKPKEEMLGKNISDIFPKKEVVKIMKVIKKSIKTHSLQVIGYELSVSAGKLFFEARITPFEKDKALALIRDITDKKQAEQALYESEKKYRRLFETMTQGVIYQLADRKIISINPAGERILGITTDKVKGKNSMDPRWQMIKEDGTPLPGLDHPTMTALRTGQKVGPVTRGIYRPDLNSYIWLEITAIPLFESGKKKPFQVYATFDDITAKRKAEQALKEQLAFEMLLSVISNTFINLPATEFDHALNIVLKKVGSFFQVDRSYILQFSTDQKFIDNTHEWCAEGINPQIDTIKHFKSDDIPWWTEKIQRADYVYVPDIEKLPSAAGSEKKEWARQSIQSLITIPIKVDGRLAASFGFDSIKAKRTWTEQKIKLLKLLTDTIANAFVKYELEKRNRQAHQRMLAVLDSLEAIIYVADMKTYEILFINSYAEKLLGDVRGKECWKVLHKDQKGPCSFCTNDRLLDKKGEPAVAYSWQHFNPKTSRWYALKDSAIRWTDGRLVRMELATDITEAKKAEQRIQYMGFHDSLTNLYNRSYMEQEMKRLNTKRQLPISIIMADLNGLKLVNDTYGHAIGDKMLQKTASILKKTCREEDIIARWGGDEFVILLPQTPEKQAANIARRILKNCEQVHIQNVPVSLALGFSHKDSYKMDLLEVLKQAENKMYDHKLTQSRSVRSTIVNVLLETLKEKSFETEQHIRKMQAFVLVMGKSLSLSEAEIDRLLLLVMLHDIGKVNIPKEVLTKKGKLTDRQWDVIKEHPQTGYRIALAVPEFSHLAEDILCHHERWDGSGYPRGLKEKGIPLLARILAIADAYEVMTNGRTYKKALSKDQAIVELRKYAGIQFDPVLVDIFISSLT